MRLLLRFIRIYAPFICSFAAFLNGVLFKMGYGELPMIYLMASVTGNSILVDLYMFSASLRMCKWFKMNLLCLLLIQICGIAYTYYDIDATLYVWAVILLASIGIICFLVFRICFVVTHSFGCNGRHSRES